MAPASKMWELIAKGTSWNSSFFFLIPGMAITLRRQEISGCFPLVRTGRPDHSIKTLQYICQILNSMQEGGGFSAKALGKSPLHCQNDWSGHNPAASSDFWKAPQVKSETETQTKHSIPELISFIISSVWANWKSTVCSTCCSLPAEKEYSIYTVN